MLQIINRISHPGHSLAGIVRKFWYLFKNDETYLKLVYFLEMGHYLDLECPQLFTEKIQWLKLNDRKHEYIRLVDKLSAKEIVSKIIGEKYIIPTLGVWDSFEEIDFSNLPNQFVLKTNHGSGSGGVIICRNKEELNLDITRLKLENGLRYNTYNKYREWPYKNIKSRIFAEQLLEFESGTHTDIADYKFFCFNGEPKYCQVIQDRSTKETIDFFDMKWNHQDFIGLNPKAKHADNIPIRPQTYDQMIDIAKKLSSDKPFARVDLYEVNGDIYFGEITFYPASGFGRFTPKEWDKRMGDLIKLPIEK